MDLAFCTNQQRTVVDVGVRSSPTTAIAASYWRASHAHAPPQETCRLTSPSTLSRGTGFLLLLSYPSDDHTWIGTHVEYFLAMIH